ncbi:MAG: LD-carboxypeptidase [Euryarchaeota archaeon]|nr:LD-carboxypeptidase [Euryarchaeota archaeon]
MLVPVRLKEGDTIGLVAPASSANTLRKDVWEIGAKRLASKGFHIKVGKHVLGQHGHSSGTVRERAEDLNRMFNDDEVNLVMSVLGGFNSHQLLEHIDFEAIASSRKAFIGFSDITALNNAIWSQAGLMNFSGPSFVTFCQPDLPYYTERCFDRMIVEGAASLDITPSERWAEDKWHSMIDLGPRQWMSNPGWDIINKGKAEGTIVGGNLSTLMLLASTKYWPDMSGTILFIEEDEDESPATIDRYMTQLRHMGAFDVINGLVIGRMPSNVGFTAGDSLRMVVEEATSGYDLPILTGVDFAHTDPLLTLPIGGKAAMNADRPSLRFVGPFVT